MAGVLLVMKRMKMKMIVTGHDQLFKKSAV